MTDLEKAKASGNQIWIAIETDRAKREAEMMEHKAEQEMFAAMEPRTIKAPTTEELDAQDRHFEEKYQCKLDEDPTAYMEEQAKNTDWF